MTAKSEPIQPLFKADSATLAFYASKDGKIDRHGSGDCYGPYLTQAALFVGLASTRSIDDRGLDPSRVIYGANSGSWRRQGIARASEAHLWRRTHAAEKGDRSADALP